MDMLWYGHKYGFVPDDDFDLLWNTCNTRVRPVLRTAGRWTGQAGRVRPGADRQHPLDTPVVLGPR